MSEFIVQVVVMKTDTAQPRCDSKEHVLGTFGVHAHDAVDSHMLYAHIRGITYRSSSKEVFDYSISRRKLKELIYEL
jgi:hypothetical protein